MDRYPNAAFPLMAVFTGMLPAASFPELAGHGSRFWTGVVIGTLIVIVPLVLLCLRRTRMQGGALLFVLTALAVFYLAAPKVFNPYDLDQPSGVEEMSASATIMGWTTLVLFATGLIMGFASGRTAGHHAWVEVADPGYAAACRCGWRCLVAESTLAFIKAGDHAGRVEIEVRPARAPSGDEIQ